MDQNKDQNLQNFEKYNKFHFLKKTWQLIVSVSLFSLVVCYSCGFSLFPRSFINVYYSTFLFSFFTHTLERKYVFLICNGILAFLARRSVSCSSSTEMKALLSLIEEFPVGVGSLENVALVVEEDQDQKYTEEEAAAKEAEEQEQDIWSYGEENERESEDLIAENEGEEEEGVSLMKQEVEQEAESVSLMKQEEAEPEAEVEELAASTDELNKKFEEFIRKMKEELRIQAQQITV